MPLLTWFVCGRCQTSSRVSLVLQKTTLCKQSCLPYLCFSAGGLVGLGVGGGNIVINVVWKMVGNTFHFTVLQDPRAIRFFDRKVSAPSLSFSV